MIKWIRRFWRNWFITDLDVSYENLTSLPDDLPPKLITLWCFYNQLTTLPENLPPKLQCLWCTNNQLTSLPKELPLYLKELSCSNNHLVSLPDKLPQSLKRLECANNQLVSLPDKLPQSLQVLCCNCNQLTSLPEKLPPNLQVLSCNNNQLTSLPKELPPTLQQLWCYNNQLTILPDLPLSLDILMLYGNPLKKNYPLINTFEFVIHVRFLHNYYGYKYPNKVIAYVNECNSRRRSQERARAITGELAELYYRKKLHPSKLAPLLKNPDTDPNDFMDHLAENI